MPAVLIHGVPDTHRVWDGVRRHLIRSDVEAWDLPGFGTPRSRGFGSTNEEYVDWLIERLERVGEPVDLVGRDWGCILTARVASLRPGLVRTWAGSSAPVTDDLGVMSRDGRRDLQVRHAFVGRHHARNLSSAEYVWHPLAKIWQDPVEGNRFMDELRPASFAKDLTEALDLTEAFDVPAEVAGDMVLRVDGTMRDSILKLYRSAETVGAQWETELANVSAPCLVFWGTLDPACPVEFAGKLGGAVRASRVVELDCNRWTVVQKPAEVAAALEAHWTA
ncbi:alpha/beta fold hydrolase [Streptomyces mirabilis]|uniref:alpha/beta fold hydrolase n=1 Tax=Streptomyces mirabilis TaxID=68239 RepID=UPI0033F62417